MTGGSATLNFMSTSVVRLGVARGRYFRENFAQGGVDLVQIIPELVTNADAAVAAAGRETGRITLEIAAPDARFLNLGGPRPSAAQTPTTCRHWRVHPARP